MLLRFLPTVLYNYHRESPFPYQTYAEVSWCHHTAVHCTCVQQCVSQRDSMRLHNVGGRMGEFRLLYLLCMLRFPVQLHSLQHLVLTKPTPAAAAGTVPNVAAYLPQSLLGQLDIKFVVSSSTTNKPRTPQAQKSEVGSPTATRLQGPAAVAAAVRLATSCRKGVSTPPATCPPPTGRTG
jgi:hypothetical protein